MVGLRAGMFTTTCSGRLENSLTGLKTAKVRAKGNRRNIVSGGFQKENINAKKIVSVFLIIWLLLYCI
jgi:hypothetical protein